MSFRAAFFKGTHAGLPGLFNRLVRALDHGPFSHMELIFSDGVSASSSYVDGGVRFKQITYDPANWEIVTLPDALAAPARAWFVANEGKAYDIMADVWQAVGFVRINSDKRMCSAACMEALGYGESWRFRPNAAYAVVKHFEGADQVIRSVVTAAVTVDTTATLIPDATVVGSTAVDTVVLTNFEITV